MMRTKVLKRTELIYFSLTTQLVRGPGYILSVNGSLSIANVACSRPTGLRAESAVCVR